MFDHLVCVLCFFPRYLNAIQTMCPHILRYLTTAVITNKDVRKRRQVLKDLVKVIQQVVDSALSWANSWLPHLKLPPFNRNTMLLIHIAAHLLAKPNKAWAYQGNQCWHRCNHLCVLLLFYYKRFKSGYAVNRSTKHWFSFHAQTTIPLYTILCGRRASVRTLLSAWTERFCLSPFRKPELVSFDKWRRTAWF